MPNSADYHAHPDDTPVGQVITRREALRLFTAPLLLGLAGCSAEDSSAADDEPITGSCVVRPEMTEGPFYVDTDLVRPDIRAGKDGARLDLTFNVSRVVGGDTCEPLENALVDVWHADAGGVYSGVGAASDARFLRGIQPTDADGNASFTTIYPGWYRGRTPHIHFKVRAPAEASSAYEFTSQLFFDDDLSRQVYQQAPYADRGAHDTTNGEDGIYGRGGSRMLLAVSETEDGYAATFSIALYVG